jgi:ribonuclease R
VSERLVPVGTSPVRAALDAVVHALELPTRFSAEVDAEVARHLADPQVDDPLLVDWTDLPFVTIDGPTSRDLDQALFLERHGAGVRVRYALADAAHYVPVGSALFAEALARGGTYYFPGFNVPMLPRALCEGLVSLNPNVERRALVFVVDLDERGEVVETSLERARIRSQAKLAFGDVQAFYDDRASSPLAHAPFAESFELLRVVGERRMLLAAERDVVRYRRRELAVTLEGEPVELVALEAVRVPVELYNEQLSLLVNREGGRLLREHPAPHLQPIYRVHGAPDPVRLDALAALARAAADLHGLDRAEVAPHPGEHLRDFLERLPQQGRAQRLARALERQAILVNVRSEFRAEPAEHFGVGAEVYARFSAPMREIVGIFVHKELLELLGHLEPGDPEADERLRLAVVDAANRARSLQRKVNDQVNRLVIDRIFERDLKTPADRRPRRVGTVMGISPSKVHVELDDPGLDVKVYVRDLGAQRAGAWLDVAESGAALRVRGSGELVCRLGDEVTVRALGHDARQDRWILAVERT